MARAGAGMGSRSRSTVRAGAGMVSRSLAMARAKASMGSRSRSTIRVGVGTEIKMTMTAIIVVVGGVVGKGRSMREESATWVGGTAATTMRRSIVGRVTAPIVMKMMSSVVGAMVDVEAKKMRRRGMVGVVVEMDAGMRRKMGMVGELAEDARMKRRRGMVDLVMRSQPMVKVVNRRAVVEQNTSKTGPGVSRHETFPPVGTCPRLVVVRAKRVCLAVAR